MKQKFLSAYPVRLAFIIAAACAALTILLANDLFLLAGKLRANHDAHA